VFFGISANFFEGLLVCLFSVAYGFFHLRGRAAKPKANVDTRLALENDKAQLAVQNLSEEDILDITAYVASLQP